MVLDLMSGGRLELGVGHGGNLTAFAGFELDSDSPQRLFVRNLTGLRDTLAGGSYPGGDTLYPSQPEPRRSHLAGDLLGLGRRAGRRWPATG